MTKTILAEAVTNRSAVQKMTVAFNRWVRPTGPCWMEMQSCSRKSRLGPRSKTVVGIINQINALAACGRAATELLFYLECAASALEKSAPRAANYHERCRACEPCALRPKLRVLAMLCTWLCIGAACAGVFAGGLLVLLAARLP